MHSITSLDGALLVGLGAGIFWFIKGFRVYRECRVVEDTPEIPIRSIPMGLVHVHGKAKGEQLVESPVTGAQCLFYKVDIERWEQDRDGGHWAHYRTDADGPRFYLEDASGSVLVDARQAEFDLNQSARRDTGSGLGMTNLGRLITGEGDPMLATTPGGFVSDADLVAYVESLTYKSTSPSALGALGSLTSHLGSSGSRYRLTEYQILPEHWYDVTGTCAENAEGKNEGDRNLIMKGQNEPTFLISWRAEKDVESKLRKRAAFHIFGGAALSVVCLGFLLTRLGWLF